MNGSNAEPALTAPSPVRVLVESFAAADAAAAGGGKSAGAARLVAGDFMADRVDDTYSLAMVRPRPPRITAQLQASALDQVVSVWQ